jgi:hypothetical protein
MKKVLLPLVIVSAVFFTACNSKKEKTDREMVLLTDSMYKSNLGSDTAAIIPQETPQVAEPEVAAPVVRTKKPTPRRSNTNYNQPVPNNTQPPAPVAVNNPAPTTPATTGTAGTGTAGTGTTTAPEVKKKEGISKAAQGAIIGGVGGAVAGAVIGKGGKGAVIGGVIGGVGGYILGAKKIGPADG